MVLSKKSAKPLLYLLKKTILLGHKSSIQLLPRKGGKQVADIKLKDREALRQSEEGTAILAAVSNETNTGETRKVTIPGIAEAQHRENPLVATWEKTTLYEPAAANQPEISSPNSSRY